MALAVVAILVLTIVSAAFAGGTRCLQEGDVNICISNDTEESIEFYWSSVISKDRERYLNKGDTLTPFVDGEELPSFKYDGKPSITFDIPLNNGMREIMVRVKAHLIPPPSDSPESEDNKAFRELLNQEISGREEYLCPGCGSTPRSNFLKIDGGKAKIVFYQGAAGGIQPGYVP